MHLASLSLHHFRNYEQLRVEVAREPVVLFGHNGAGKTNILEAISLLIPGRGLRRAALGEISTKPSPLEGEGGEAGGNISSIISVATTPHPNPRPQGGRENWAIIANIHGIKGEVTLATGKDVESETEKRLVKIDGKPAPQSHLAQHASILWLTPQIEQLFLEGASEGRKFLDRLVYSFDAEHASYVNAYDTAMRERNRLLEQGRADAAWLTALEKTMSEKAACIASGRLATIARLNATIAESTLSFPKPLIAVQGVVEEMLASGSSLSAEERFAAMLSEDRARDAAAGRALCGVHRSELVVTHKARGTSASQCSTGEQKALMLSIILAQARACAAARNIVPMILLDEVVAHLDPSRRLELFEEITAIRAQVWMSGTDASLFDGIRGGAQFFEVKNGRVL